MRKRLFILLLALPLVVSLRAETVQRLESSNAGTIKQDNIVEVFFLMNHEIKVMDGESTSSEKKRCIDELVTKTEESFSVESYKVMNITSDNKDGADTIRCEISVKAK